MDKTQTPPGRDGNSVYDPEAHAGKKAYTGKPVTSNKVKKDMLKLLKKNFNTEDVAVNNVGGGNVAGLGVGPQGEPPKHKALLSKLKTMLKRKVPNVGSKLSS